MIHNESRLIRILIFILGGTLIVTGYLVVRINPDEVGYTYMGLLAATAAVGLLSNPWGGLAASVIGSFAIIIVDQYIGIYPHESYLLNISSELVGFLVVGPLSGSIRMQLDKLRGTHEHWVRVAEGRAVHDEVFGTLKPRWFTYRLEEEMLRARRFHRPFSIAVMSLDCLDEESKKDRQAALQALIRMARAVTQPPTVIAYLGNDQILIVLPEYDAEATRAVLVELQNRVETELYFPQGNDRHGAHGLGKPLGSWGRLRTGVVSLGEQAGASEMIAQARKYLDAG